MVIQLVSHQIPHTAQYPLRSSTKCHPSLLSFKTLPSLFSYFIETFPFSLRLLKMKAGARKNEAEEEFVTFFNNKFPPSCKNKIHRRREREKRKIVPERRPHHPLRDMTKMFIAGWRRRRRKAKIIKGKLTLFTA